MDRKTACLAQERLCREQAEDHPSDRDRWLAKAAKWARIARTCTGHVAVTHEIKDGRMVPKTTKGL
jgi:hypothetical protein